MTQRRQYDYNIDIRSTQADNAAQKTRKGLRGLYYLLTLMVILSYITIGVPLLPALFVQDMLDKKRGVKNLDFIQLNKDYSDNIVRAQKTWQNRYVSISGQITEISHGYIKVRDVDGEVKCTLEWFKGGIIADLHKGQKVWVIGKNGGLQRDDYMVLRHCRIQNVYIDLPLDD